MANVPSPITAAPTEAGTEMQPPGSAKVALAALDNRYDRATCELEAAEQAYTQRLSALAEFAYRLRRSLCQTKGEQWQVDAGFAPIRKLTGALQGLEQPDSRGKIELRRLTDEIRRRQARFAEDECARSLEESEKSVRFLEGALASELRALAALYPEPGERLDTSLTPETATALLEQIVRMVLTSFGLHIEGEAEYAPWGELAGKVRAAKSMGTPTERLPIAWGGSASIC